MLKFLSPLVAEALDDGDHWKLHNPLVIDMGLTGNPLTDILTIPVDFVTDFGSIPSWIPNWIANPQGKAKRSYVMHDYLYKNQLNSRLVDDALLNEGMIVDGVNWFQRFTVYRGIRLGGWLTWGKYEEEFKNAGT